jgi:hypothetical protein
MIVSLVGIIFFLIGLAALVSGIISVLKVRRQVAGSAKATGTVINFAKTMGRSGYLYCPQVDFADETGKRIGFQSKVGAQPPAYAVGQRVQVIYKRSNPLEAEIDSLASLWFAPGCMVLFSLAFTVLGLILFGVGLIVQFGTYTNNGK